MRQLFIALSIFAAAGLSGCGVKGTLKTPPPLFDKKAKAPVEAQPTPAPADETDSELDRLLENLGE